jgi:hypothetical protein
MDPVSEQKLRRAPVIEAWQYKKSGQARWHRGKKYHLWRLIRQWQGDQNQRRKQR